MGKTSNRKAATKADPNSVFNLRKKYREAKRTCNKNKDRSKRESLKKMKFEAKKALRAAEAKEGIKVEHPEEIKEGDREQAKKKFHGDGINVEELKETYEKALAAHLADPGERYKRRAKKKAVFALVAEKRRILEEEDITDIPTLQAEYQYFSEAYLKDKSARCLQRHKRELHTRMDKARSANAKKKNEVKSEEELQHTEEKEEKSTEAKESSDSGDSDSDNRDE